MDGSIRKSKGLTKPVRPLHVSGFKMFNLSTFSGEKGEKCLFTCLCPQLRNRNDIGIGTAVVQIKITIFYNAYPFDALIGLFHPRGGGDFHQLVFVEFQSGSGIEGEILAYLPFPDLRCDIPDQQFLIKYHAEYHIQPKKDAVCHSKWTAGKERKIQRKESQDADGNDGIFAGLLFATGRFCLVENVEGNKIINCTVQLEMKKHKYTALFLL